jgi:DNA-directed RNA polymerase subunit H (RpoH/RPB5)
MSNTTDTLNVYRSRVTILDILKNYLYYDVAEYDDFSVHEVEIMKNNEQLDMLVQNKDTQNKAYIKYCLNVKMLKSQTIDEYVEDLFVIDELLNKSDTLMIIMQEEPNDTVLKHIHHLYNKDGIFIVVHSIHRLQANILKHELVPQMFIMDDAEKTELKKELNITVFKQLPEISRFDPQALAMCMRPNDVGQFIRKSVTSLNYNYYRVCV